MPKGSRVSIGTNTFPRRLIEEYRADHLAFLFTDLAGNAKVVLLFV